MKLSALTSDHDAVRAEYPAGPPPEQLRPGCFDRGHEVGLRVPSGARSARCRLKYPTVSLLALEQSARSMRKRA